MTLVRVPGPSDGGLLSGPLAVLRRCDRLTERQYGEHDVRKEEEHCRTAGSVSESLRDAVHYHDGKDYAREDESVSENDPKNPPAGLSSAFNERVHL